MMSRSIPRSAVILIIDADPVMLIGMAAVLDQQGYECHCASDRSAARKAVATLPLDLIICDANFEGTSGEQLCRDWQREAHQEDVPLIMIGDSRCEQLPQATFNVDTYNVERLQPPFAPHELIEVVAKILWMPHLISTRLHQPRPATSSVVPAPAATRRSGAPDSQRR